MKLMKFKSNFLICALICTCFHSSFAATNYPNKAIHLILPVPAGNANDIVGRILADRLSKIINQPVLVENKVGGGGNIGAEFSAKSNPDGYTVLIASSGIFTANPYLYKLNFDPLQDFIPVTLIYSGAPFLVVSPKLKYSNLQELIEAAKKQPGKLTYASYGSGHVSHIIAEMFKSSAGIDLLHIPYKNSPLPDVMSGEVDMIFESPLLVINNVSKLRPLGVVSPKRNSKLPEVQSISEVLPGFEMIGWVGAFVQSGTPMDVVQVLYNSLVKAIKSPEFKSKLDDLMLEPGAMTPEEFSQFVKNMSIKVGHVIQEAKIKAD
jgi:tripartite-type tricarboxylate transporter receptor subunit TctC